MEMKIVARLLGRPNPNNPMMMMDQVLNFVGFDRQFKLKMEQEKDGKEDSKWKMLVKKVVSAKTISSLGLPKRKRAAAAGDTTSGDRIRSFRLQCVEPNGSVL